MLLAHAPPFAYPRRVQVILAVYSLGFLAGTYTHVQDVWQHGVLAWPVSLPIGVFWNVLTLLDPLTVLLLWTRPKAGIWLAGAIMVLDISLNTSVYLGGYLGAPRRHMVPLSLFEQSLFGLFVLVTAPVVYRWVARRSALHLRPQKQLAQLP